MSGRFHRLALISLIALLLLVAHGPAQDASPRPLIITLRDMAGTPLEEVQIVLYRPGQSLSDFIEEETDETGTVTYTVRPGDYLIGFTGKWRGYRFIDLGKQNSGAMTNEQGYGGFALYLDPTSASYNFAFTVGMNDQRELVPFYDLAEDLSEIPDPYLYDPQSVGDEVAIDPVGVGELTLAPLQPTPLSEEERETVRQQSAERSQTVLSTIFLVIALIFCGIIVIVMWVVLISNSRATDVFNRDE
jgi:hypothetical protein